MSLIFIESVIHNWLFIKGLYPPEAFVSKNLFGINIKAVAENSLRTYIQDFIQSIEDLHFKGILHSVSLLLVKNQEVVENFLLSVNWIMNIYALADNDKILSQINLENFFGRILADIHMESEQMNKELTFQIVIETVKEESSEAEEVLARENWALVSQDTQKAQFSQVAAGIFILEWGNVRNLT